MLTLRQAAERRRRSPPVRRPFRLVRTMAMVMATVLALAPLLHPAAAQADPGGREDTELAPASTERGVKAMMLYKFLGYVDFPSGPLDPGAPYVVGVVGADDVAAELARLTLGRTINNHGVVVRRLQDGEMARGMHLLFIGAAEGAGETALVKAAALAGVMSVTESATGIASGSVINFVLVDDRVRFEVSLAAAEKNKLKLSSRLLSVALAVQKGGG